MNAPVWAYIAHKDGYWGAVIAAIAVSKADCVAFVGKHSIDGFTVTPVYSRKEYQEKLASLKYWVPESERDCVASSSIAGENGAPESSRPSLGERAERSGRPGAGAGGGHPPRGEETCALPAGPAEAAGVRHGGGEGPRRMSDYDMLPADCEPKAEEA